MKVNKLKTLLYCVGTGVLLTTLTVDAATLTFSEGIKENNTITYEVFVTPSDGESLENKKITVSSNQNNISKSYANTNDTIAKCEGDMCTIFSAITSKTSIAKIKLTNNASTEIQGVALSLLPDGNWASKVETQATNLAATVEETTTTQKTLSSKAELTNLTVSVGTMEPGFNVSERSYTIKGIKDTVNSITFSPTCDNCVTEFICIENCSVNDSKNNRIMLEDGANTIKLKTTSEDGKSHTEYNFTVYRGEIEEPSAYLEEVTIKGVELSPKFDMLLNDYSVNVDLDVESLEIEYVLEDPEATVEIKGADDLKEGENTVTITVTSSDGKSKQVYTITVNKEDLCDPEKEDCEEEAKDTVVIEKKKNNKVWLIVLLVIIALGIIGGSGYLIFKKKKKNDKDDKKNKKNNSGKGEKIKNMLIESDDEDEQPLDEAILKNDEVLEENKEEIIKPRVKPSVDDALDDLMKTKEIELNNL